MNISAVRAVMTEARGCAMAMLENASYIQKQLPNVRMNDALRQQTQQVCTSLIGTKYDIISELSELDELLGSASESVILSRVDRIVQWLQEGITRTHGLVLALETASKQDPACAGAYILASESATNILVAFNRTKAAADSLHAGESGRRQNGNGRQTSHMAQAPRPVPKPEDFGLTPQEAELFRPRDEKLSGFVNFALFWAGVVCCVALVHYLFKFLHGGETGHHQMSLWESLSYTIAAFVGGFAVGRGLGRGLSRLRAGAHDRSLRRHPKYPNYLRYEEAFRPYREAARLLVEALGKAKR
jgi:hypothetical protein